MAQETLGGATTGANPCLEVTLRYETPLVEARLVRRYKRFLADVVLPDGREVTAHCPNSGRMTGCWVPDGRCRVSYAPSPRRKLDWTLEQTFVNGVWCMVHTGRTNAIVAEGVAAGVVPELAGWPTLRREVRAGDSRIDLQLTDGDRRVWVEVKNVTLPGDDGVGRFPDAVSARATKHLHHLAGLVARGDRAVALFHVGRADLRAVGPAHAVDPTFAAAFVAAQEAGVEMMAWRSRVEAHQVVLDVRVPVVG